MSLSESPTASEHEIRFLAWQEKNRRSDQLAEKRVKIAFAVIVVVLLLVILYSWRQAIELERLQDSPSEVRSGLQELRKQTTELSSDVQALSHHQGAVKRHATYCCYS